MYPYRKHRQFTFKSEEKAWVNGGKGSLEFEGFVETKGPNGFRTVIDGFTIHALANLTVTVTDLNGKDKWMLIRGLTVEMKDGTKRIDDIPGDALRIYNYGVLGAARVPEFATQTAGSGATTSLFSAYVPMTKPLVYNPLDFAMAADVFKLIRIRQAVPADFQSGTVAITSITYWVVAHCHEEQDVVQHAVDTVSIRDFDATNETALNIHGRLHDLYLYAPGANGSQAFADVVDARVVELMESARYIMPDLAMDFAMAREQAANSASTQGGALRDDPFRIASGTVQAIPLLFSDGNKIGESPELARCHIKLTSGTPPGGAGTAHTGSMRCIVRVVEPRSEKLERAVANKYKARGAAPKVAKATNAAPSTKERPYLPVQFRK